MSTIDTCHIPTPMPAAEAKVYRTLREAHCGQAHASHDCIGVVSLDQRGITMRCKRCGDARSLYPEDLS